MFVHLRFPHGNFTLCATYSTHSASLPLFSSTRVGDNAERRERASREEHEGGKDAVSERPGIHGRRELRHDCVVPSPYDIQSMRVDSRCTGSSTRPHFGVPF